MKRREFLASVGAAAIAASSLKVSGASNIFTERALPFVLPPLPYAQIALKPVISPETIGFHYGKHHKGYVDKLNELAKGTKYADMSLEDVVLKSAKSKGDIAVFNNAAQIWNHNFYWNSLSPNGVEPSAKMKQRIDESFGNFDNFKKQFADVAISQFGTGWGWLVADKKGKLSIVKTGDADVPMTQKLKPLLTIDVWEHAYYLDYQNRRADYVKSVIDRLLNWDFAEKNLG